MVTTKNKYKSGFESKIAKYLEDREVDFIYEKEKIPYVVPSKARNYIPDFKLSNGIYVEGKGKLDRDVREKMALVIEQNPDKDIRFLFMRDNKLTRTSKMRYSGWCEKRGIKYAVSEYGHVPEEWLAEAGPIVKPAAGESLDPSANRKPKRVASDLPARGKGDTSVRHQGLDDASDG